MNKKYMQKALLHMKRKHVSFICTLSGEVVTIDELLSKLWGRRVEIDEAINYIK